MTKESFCFCFDGKFDVHDYIASSDRLCFHDFECDITIASEDLLAIRIFYDYSKKSYDTPMCLKCALCRVLNYTSKYDNRINY